MKRRSSKAVAIAVFLASLQCVFAEEPTARLRFVEDAEKARIESNAAITIHSAEQTLSLPPGIYSLDASATQPETRRAHLFAKSFPPDREMEMLAYLAEWRERGFTPEVVQIGLEHAMAGRKPLDNRVNWISVAQVEGIPRAERLKKQLDDSGVYAWIQEQTVTPGAGMLTIRDRNGVVAGSLALPVRITSHDPIQVHAVDTGYWSEARKSIAAAGELLIGVGPRGGLTVDEEIGVEEYLRGVLPAEMPALWHKEALKAQAICARSDVLAHLGGRQTLLGYDFFVTEQSRAYAGVEGRMPQTDAALRETAGEILIKDNRIVPAVFSANCGGHSENNDTIWSGPPDDALRGVSDHKRRGKASGSLQDRLHNTQNVYCSRDAGSFRWKRVYTEAELRAMMPPTDRVGRIQTIEMGDRGVSGRLKWVGVTGSEGKAAIRKDLPIRRAFGNLPSSLFTVDRQTINGETVYVFEGLGRGHGVGLCQQGAQGRAESGQDYRSIVRHYFAGAELRKVD